MSLEETQQHSASLLESTVKMNEDEELHDINATIDHLDSLSPHHIKLA